MGPGAMSVGLMPLPEAEAGVEGDPEQEWGWVFIFTAACRNQDCARPNLRIAIAVY